MWFVLRVVTLQKWKLIEADVHEQNKNQAASYLLISVVHTSLYFYKPRHKNPKSVIKPRAAPLSTWVCSSYATNAYPEIIWLELVI